MSLQKYFESKGQLEEIISIAATSQNFSEKQIEDEIAGASTQGQNSNSKNWRVDISISNKKKMKNLVQYINTHFVMKTSSSQLINCIWPTL